MKKHLTVLLLLLGTLLLCQCSKEDENSTTIRLGCFPNVTHVQGLVARNMWRNKSCEGKGWFETHVPGYTEEWYTFNAGPTAMEALFGKTVDVTCCEVVNLCTAYLVLVDSYRTVGNCQCCISIMYVELCYKVCYALRSNIPRPNIASCGSYNVCVATVNVCCCQYVRNLSCVCQVSVRCERCKALYHQNRRGARGSD